MVADKSEKTEKTKNKKALTVIESLLAGALSGCVGKTVIAPLDRAKILYQVTTKPYTNIQAVKDISRTIRELGVAACFRGNGAQLVRIIPYASSQFLIFEQFKQLTLSLNDQKDLKPLTRTICGALAGTCSVMITYPLDVLRTRMGVDQSKVRQYKHIHSALIGIARKEGIGAFYRGILPSIYGVIPYTGLAFGFFETAKAYLKDEKGNLKPSYRVVVGGVAGIIYLYFFLVAIEFSPKNTSRLPENIFPVSNQILFYIGLLGQSVAYPLEIVRRRMQVDTIGKYTSGGSLRAMSIIIKEEGFSALFKGLSMNYLKAPLSVGLSMASFDFFKTKILEFREIRKEKQSLT